MADVRLTVLLTRHNPDRDVSNMLYWKEDVHEHALALRGSYSVTMYVNGAGLDDILRDKDYVVIRRDDYKFKSFDQMVTSAVWKNRHNETKIMRERLEAVSG